MYQLVEKLRLQCSAVYCLSWLFSLRSFQFPVFLLPSSFSSNASFLFQRITIFRSAKILLLGVRREVTLGSSGLGDGNEEDFFIPTGVERVAIPRGEPPWSCKSYEQVIRGVARGKRKGWLAWRRKGVCNPSLVTTGQPRSTGGWKLRVLLNARWTCDINMRWWYPSRYSCTFYFSWSDLDEINFSQF